MKYRKYSIASVTASIFLLIITILRDGDKGDPPPLPYSTSKNGEKSTRRLSVVFSLAKEQSKWKVTKVNEFTVYEEMLGVNWRD